MGRGSLYRYEHYMLFDSNEHFGYEAISCHCCEYQEVFYGYNESPNMCPNCGKKLNVSYEFDNFFYEDFKAHVALLTKADKIAKWIDREAYIFAETEKMEIGIDTSGGLTALFVKPKTYFHNFSEEEKEYTIHKIVKKAFNNLIKEYKDMFRSPTSAWTSEHITQY